jgi:hypothetical protein
MRKRAERLAERLAKLPPEHPEWQALANELFEARCDLGYAVAAARPERYRCTECGKTYNAAWVRHNGLRCDAECDGWLEEVR